VPVKVVKKDGLVQVAKRSSVFTFQVGETYPPKRNALMKDSLPKRVVDASLFAEEWCVALQPVEGGRSRLMSIDSFLLRYDCPKTPLSLKEGRVKRRESVSRSRLARIEQKLDLLLEALGVKPGEKKDEE
jgi:hypothetical protein